MDNIPESELWNSAQVAAALGVDRGVFMRTARFAAGFPQAIKLPGVRPRWSARAVREWIANQSHAEAA